MNEFSDIERPAVVAYPWFGTGDPTVNSASGDISRGYVILPAHYDEVLSVDSKDPLPLACLWTDNRKPWRKYELPRGESAANRSRLSLSSHRGDAIDFCSVTLGSGIARSWLDEQLESGEDTAEKLRYFSEQRDVVDSHVEIVNDLSDSYRSKPYYWEGDCEGLFVRSVYRVAAKWLRTQGRDQARLSLIVKLARDLTRVLERVCDQPRVVLKRTREFQKISKIQQVDPACLRWLARQPGRDIYERAGPRQEILGLVRREDTDTLENRVVKDLLRRARVECASYLATHRAFSSHIRFRNVSRFRSNLIDWEVTSPVSRATELSAAAQPNYVLLHDSNYRKLWDAYQLLLSQQKLKDDIWKWRDRTFAESCSLGVLSLLKKIVRRSEFMRSDVIFQFEATAGNFVSNKSQFGSARWDDRGNDVQIYFCFGSQVQCPYIDRSLYPLAADFFLILRRFNKTEVVIPFWCLFDAEKDSFDLAVQILENKLGKVPASEKIAPVVLVHKHRVAKQSIFGNHGAILDVRFPLIETIENLESFILDLLAKI